MNVLVIGGSGYVASLILPILLQRHNLRIFDLLPPALWQMETEFRDSDPNDTMHRTRSLSRRGTVRSSAWAKIVYAVSPFGSTITS